MFNFLETESFPFHACSEPTFTKYSIIFLKCFSDSQKRKSVTSPAPHSQSKNCQESVEMIAEEESEPLQELIDGNFPVSISDHL